MGMVHLVVLHAAHSRASAAASTRRPACCDLYIRRKDRSKSGLETLGRAAVHGVSSAICWYDRHGLDRLALHESTSVPAIHLCGNDSRWCRRVCNIRPDRILVEWRSDAPRCLPGAHRSRSQYLPSLRVRSSRALSGNKSEAALLPRMRPTNPPHRTASNW